jgi:hypothetical protein
MLCLPTAPRIPKLSNLRRCSSQDRGRKTQRFTPTVTKVTLDYNFFFFLRCVSPWESRYRVPCIFKLVVRPPTVVWVALESDPVSPL